MGTNDLCLRPLPYLDAKWLRVDLYGALRGTECTAVQFNNLVKDNELVVSNDGVQHGVLLNSAGCVSYVNSFGKHYCGVLDISCLCSNGSNCAGICRPDTECSCEPCHQLDEETTKKSSTCVQNRAHYEPSDTILDSWLWGPIPNVEQKAHCIKSLLTEQRELSLQAASHSLSTIHLKQRLSIYHRYFIALSRFKSTKNDDCYSDTIEGQVDVSYQKCGSIDSLVMKDAEKAALARVGARAALNFSFAFLRRAWRSGEDTDLCSELLTDALAALQGLPEASLFDSSQVSALWIEVLERSTKFLRQVVLGDVMGGRCIVPRSDRHIALSLLLELGSQKGTLSASLEAILLLLTLWDKEKDEDDNRTPNQSNGAPLVPILRRYEHISSESHSKVLEGTSAASPTESFLRFLTLPDSESANIDLRQAAVVIISHLDRLAKPQLPTGSYAPKTKRTKQLQQILTLGSFSVSSDNYGFTTEYVTEFPMLGTGSKYSTTYLDLGANASIKQIIFSEKHVYILTTVGEVFMLDNEITTEPKVEPVDIFGSVPVIQIAGYWEGKCLFALNEKREVFVLSVSDGRSSRGDVALKIQAFSDKFVKAIYCGSTYCCALTVSGGLYTFGRGITGCGAVISEEKFVPNVVQSMFGHMVVDVALSDGDSNSLCVTSDGNVYAWNDVDLGKAGSSYSGGSQFPVQIEGLSRICRVFSCSEFNVALSFDGSVYVWSNKNGGRPCVDMTDEKSKANVELLDYSPQPRRVQPLEGKNIVDAAVGSTHCLLITSTGDVYGFGRNDYNQICPKSISSATIITTPVQVTPSSLRTTGISCGPAQSILWSNTSTSGIAPKIPFVVDLNEPTFRLIEQLLAIVCGQTAITSEIRHPPNQESECIAVASLNLLRLQLHALITNNINPQTIGLGEGSRLLTSLKTRILSLAGGTILKTMQDAAQWTLQIGWSVFLPTAAERAQTLTSLLPSDPSASTSGHRFMTDLLVGSLMAEEGLQTALKQAINSEPEDSSSGHNLPLLHLIKQLLRNNAALTQARLGQLMVGPYIKSEDDYVQPEFPSASLDLLHRFQRLLLSHMHQSKNEDLAGAEALLAKYMQQIITLSVATLTKANEVVLQGKDGIVPVLATDISDTLLYELVIGLILLHRDGTSTILPSFEWTKMFVPLLNCLDCLNRIICDADVQDTDNMGWPAIFCRGSQKPVSTQDDASLIRQCDIENHIASSGKWIIISGHVYDVEGYHCDIGHVNELLCNGAGKDLTSELCNPLYRVPFEHITSHLKVGKFVLNDSDEKTCGFQNISLTHLNTEQALAYLLGLRACMLQRGPTLQPAEIQCKNLLNSPILIGGLQVLQPSNPFDEEKGEARSSASTAGSTPTEASSLFAELPQPALWPHMLITHRVDSLLTGLSEARLTDPLVSTWYTISDRFCKENSFIWHQDFPPEHPISELERHLTAVFIRHQSLGPLVLAVVDRELSGASDKLPKPVADVIKLVHQTKFTLIKTRQQLNRSYKEVCAPMLEKCRFLLYEVRPAISMEQLALKRLNILRKPTRFKSLVRRIITDIRTAKVLHDIAKPDDILNVTIQSQTGARLQSNENLKKINSTDNLLSNKTTSSTDNINDVDGKRIANENFINVNDSNVTSEKKDPMEGDTKTPNNLDCRRFKTTNEWDDFNDQFVNDFIAKLSEKSMQICDNSESLSSVMTLIVDFILQDNCDVETVRRAMYCQVQRYQIRKRGLEMFAELLNVKGLLDAVTYNVLSGYLGLFLEKTKQHYLGNILDDLNMITAFQKADLLLCHKTIIEWAIFELQKFVNQEQIFGKQKSHAGKDNSNLGTYVFATKLPRARFLLSVFGILSKDLGGNEISLVINSGALGSILGLLRQCGGEPASSKVCNEQSFVYEDAVVRKAPKTNVTGAELAKLMKIGTRVVRGVDWKWGSQDDSGNGRIISEVGEDGWVRVEWDNGSTNSYRMGKEGQYDLRLADNTSSVVSPDAETEDDVSLIEMQLTGNSHPTKLLRSGCTKMLKIISVCVGQHGDKMEKNAVACVASMFRSVLSSKIGFLNQGLEHWTTLGFLRAISSSKQFSKLLTSPIWINLHIDILNAPITCEQDVYKKVHSLRLLQATLVNCDDTQTELTTSLVEKLFTCLGKICLYCPNDLSLAQNPSDIKARVLLGASNSSTIAEESIALLRRLHTLPLWNGPINSFLSNKLCISTEFLDEQDSDCINEHEKGLIVAALNLIGGCDSRPRIGLNITYDGLRGTICSFTPKGKVIANVHNSSDVKKLSIAVAQECADIGAFSLSRMKLNEMLINSWTVLLNGPSEWKTNLTSTQINATLLRSQQIHLAALNGTTVLFRHQNILRKILRQRAPGISRYSSDESISDHGNENVSPDSQNDGTSSDEHVNNNELLIQTILTRATQANPLKAQYSYSDLALAALALSQWMSSQIHTEMNAPLTTVRRPIPPPVQPTLIHGVPIYNPIYNDGLLDDLQTPSSESSNLCSGTRASNRKLTPMISQIVEMGFSRKSINLALKAVGNQIDSLPNIDQIVQWILEHPDQCPPLHNASKQSDLNGDSDSDCGSIDTVECFCVNDKYATRDDFPTADAYAQYIREKIVPGMTVRCCRDFEEIHKGDIGTVVKVDAEGLHDLNVQVDWQMHSSAYWMCFVHIEILEPPKEDASVSDSIVVGSHVRIKSNVSAPRYKWGSVLRGSVGVVTAINESGDVTVDFPQQFCWTGQLSEMELVCQGNLSSVQNEAAVGGDLIEDWSRCIRSLTVSSNEAMAKHLLDKTTNYWQSSSGGIAKNWIRLEMHENVLVHLITITVSPADRSHMPSLVVVRVGDSVDTLKDFGWVYVKPTDTVIQLLSDVREYHNWIEIVIKQCRNNGIQCKIHGINIIGRRKQTDLDLMLTNAGFLATEFDSTFEPSYSSSSYPEDKHSKDQLPKVLVWGLNDKEQLGGLKGSKIKVPSASLTLSQLRPVHISGGSKSLFIVSQDGKVYACGEGTNGRLGLGHNYNVSTPRKVPILNQYVVKKVAVHSGGKHAMALTLDGKVLSWGEGEDGKTGHGNRLTLDKPKLIETLKSKRIRDIACGSSHSAAITSSGELYTWGLGEYGRLGHGDNCTQLKPKLVAALLDHRIVQVACGSRDAQTLALTEAGLLFSWGDGDFGKLGRGGSEGCSIPHQVERLNGVGVVQIECGAQFSLALTKAGEIWTWGKGDYYRLGHNSDQHVRKPTPIQGLRGLRVIHVAVGALHCLAVTDTGQVFAWGDNDHGQQGSGTTSVNKKPCAVIGLDSVFVNRVACGSSHSVAWCLPQSTVEEDKKEPVPFSSTKDPLGSNGLGIYDQEPQVPNLPGTSKTPKQSLSTILLSLESNSARQVALSHVLNAMSIIQARQCIQAALACHSQIVNYSEKCGDNETYFKELESLHNPNNQINNQEVIARGGGEGPVDPSTLALVDASSPDSESLPPLPAGPFAAFQSLTGSVSLSASISSQKQSKLSASAMSVMAATITHQDEVINENGVAGLDEFTSLLGESEAKGLLELLKLSVAGRTGSANTSQTIANTLIALGTNSSVIGSMILETCITELEDLCTSRHFLGKMPKPVVQETSHPYIDDITLVGHVKIPGAEALRLEFDTQCSTEKRNDPLIIMDGSGRVIASRSGREFAQWAPEIRVTGDEMRWKFTSDSSVNGWGWKFWVHAIMPPFFLQELGSDRAVLSQPSMDLVMALLDPRLVPSNKSILLRLAAAVSACAQLCTLTTPQRIWALKKLHEILTSKYSPKPLDPSLSSFLMPFLPCLLKQYEYEESQVRGGVHLMHSEYFKTMAALACDMQLDSLLPQADIHKWAWFKRYCCAVRVAQSLINRTPLPRTFVMEVRKKLSDMLPNQSVSAMFGAANGLSSSMTSLSSSHNATTSYSSASSSLVQYIDSVISLASIPSDGGEIREPDNQYLQEDHSIFKAQHDRQLLQWLNRRPEDWKLSCNGASTIYGWGHNHRGQLGGLEGGRIKSPTPCESLSLLRPIQLCGGEQTLFAVTPDGRLFATGYGAGGRLGIGGTDSMSTPILVESLQHVFIKKVAVNSGGKHCLALTDSGNVYSWGEGEDGKLGHGNRVNYDRPKLIEALSGIGIIDIACGSAHSAVITSSGHVMTFGKGRYGRLGHGDSEDQLRPKLVEALLNQRCVDIACGSGDAQTLCITDDDNVWSFGDGDYGKLGRGGSDGCKVPMKIESLAGLGVNKVECGSQFSVALTRSGSVYTWGKGDYHRLGHGTVDHVRRPKKVAALQGKKIVSIATGSLHCVCCSDQGEVFTWGDNDEGQLGDGTVSAIQRPRLVTSLQGKHIVKVTCGSAHTLALSTTQLTEGSRPPPIPPLEYDFVRELPPEALHARLVLLHHFSELLCPCIAMLPISGELSLGALKDLLVYSIKEASFRKVIQTTMVRDKQHGPVVELNRIQVKRSRSRSGGGLAGVDGLKSVFGQMVQKLPVLNQEALYLPHRVWKVKFVGESVDDCGGGFSESIAEMCDELQNGCVPLLIQTPNGAGEAGANRDCFLLDPTLTSVLQMNMFRFLGVLMGIAVRTGSPLSLNLAEPVWRQLAGETLRPSDLTEVDRDYVASLLCIRDMEDDPKVFQTLELPFSTPSAKGHEVPLSTRYTRITPQNKNEYVRLALNHRLHEFDEQVKAVRDGMSKVIPVPLLSLFTATQLQAMVCGSPEIPLSLLKSVATYKGIDATSSLVQWFWEVMEEFSNQERSLFLRFVWGRTRLPRTIADFRGRDFVLQVLDKYNPPDHFLPESYTCFFLLKMPRYSCKSVLLEKLKYAIYFCKSIDTDEYARVAMVEPTEATVSENNSDLESEVSEEM